RVEEQNLRADPRPAEEAAGAPGKRAAGAAVLERVRCGRGDWRVRSLVHRGLQWAVKRPGQSSGGRAGVTRAAKGGSAREAACLALMEQARRFPDLLPLEPDLAG